MPDHQHKTVLIIGGGTAGITTAAHLVRAGAKNVAIIEPSATHYYQPLWTLVGGGVFAKEVSTRPQTGFIPPGVDLPRTWFARGRRMSPSSSHPPHSTISRYGRWSAAVSSRRKCPHGRRPA